MPGRLGGVQVGPGGLELGPDPGGGGRPHLVGEAPLVGEDAAIDPGQRLGVGLLLLPEDRFQLLDPPAHGHQALLDLLLGGGADHPGGPVGRAGQLVEAADDLVAGAGAAPLVAPAATVQQHAAGGQDPPGLGQRPLPVRDQVEHVDLDHGVEAGVGERQPGRVGPQHRRGCQPGRGRLGPVALQHGQGQVDADRVAAAAVQGQGDPPGPDPDLQQLSARPDRRLDPVGDQLLGLGASPRLSS